MTTLFCITISSQNRVDDIISLITVLFEFILICSENKLKMNITLSRFVEQTVFKSIIDNNAAS